MSAATGLTQIREPLRLLRQLRTHCEAQMTPDFNPTLSLVLDEIVQMEEAFAGEESQP